MRDGSILNNSAYLANSTNFDNINTNDNIIIFPTIYINSLSQIASKIVLSLQICANILEKVLLFLGVEAEEGDGVGHHPDVATAAVVVGHRPLAVPISFARRQNL